MYYLSNEYMLLGLTGCRCLSGTGLKMAESPGRARIEKVPIDRRQVANARLTPAGRTISFINEVVNIDAAMLATNYDLLFMIIKWATNHPEIAFNIVLL